MNVYRYIEVRGEDPMGAMRGFLAAWWAQNGFGAMLAPVELPERPEIVTRPIEDPAELEDVNPFAPLMVHNSASMLEAFAHNYPGERLAAILRPCELRALVELRKQHRTSAEADAIAIVGVDCLGTFSPADYARERRVRGAVALARSGLAQANDGGFARSLLRRACQLCDWPAPRGADVTLSVIGVDTERLLLVTARDQATDSQWHLGEVTTGFARESDVARHEATVGSVADRQASDRSRILANPAAGSRLDDLGTVLSWFANCTLCGDCLDACPLYDGELSGMLGVGGDRYGTQAPLSELVDVSRWLASCSGCGMCEEGCVMGVPLSVLVAALSHRIRGQLRYAAGDPARALPWVRA